MHGHAQQNCEHLCLSEWCERTWCTVDALFQCKCSMFCKVLDSDPRTAATPAHSCIWRLQRATQENHTQIVAATNYIVGEASHLSMMGTIWIIKLPVCCNAFSNSVFWPWSRPVDEFSQWVTRKAVLKKRKDAFLGLILYVLQSYIYIAIWFTYMYMYIKYVHDVY